MTPRLTSLITRGLVIAVALGVTAASGMTARAATATNDDVGRSMVDYTYQRASAEFYKKTDSQAILDGAVTGMRTAVKSHGGDPNKLPSVHAAGSDSADIAALNHELVIADHTYGASGYMTSFEVKRMREGA